MTTDTITRPTTATAPGTIDPIWHQLRSTGDPELRNELLVRYLPLVKYVASRLRASIPREHDLSDLVSEGVLGLVDAISKFDPDRGIQFQTYATRRVQGAIIDSLRAEDWVPRSVRDRKRRLEDITARLTSDLCRTPTLAEIAGAAEVSVADIHKIRRRPCLVKGVTDDDIDALAPALMTDWNDEATRIVLVDAVKSLSERDQQVILMYFFDGLTLAEIGRALGVTEGRVSQLRTRALKALRAHLDT